MFFFLAGAALAPDHFVIYIL